MSEALKAGIHRDTLRAMIESGELDRLTRGLYRLAGAAPAKQPDLLTVAAKVPQGVICLVSALAFHEITTQIPHEVHIAISRNSQPPRLDYPPIRTFRFTGAAFTEGIEKHRVDGQMLRVYSIEKTLADCFKFRNKIGLEVCVEALRRYRERRGFKPTEVLRYAEICRVSRVIRPYLEALL